MPAHSPDWPRHLTRRRWTPVTVSDVFDDRREAMNTIRPDWPRGWQHHRQKVAAHDLTVMLATKEGTDR